MSLFLKKKQQQHQQFYPTFRNTAHNTRKLTEFAAMIFPSTMKTQDNRFFITTALKIGHPCSAMFVYRAAVNQRRLCKTQFSASRISVLFVPMLVTDPSPGIVIIDLNQAFTGKGFSI